MGDETRPVRSGEELDTTKLAAFLRETLQLDGPLVVEQFPGGHSNLTYLVRIGDRELVLRRPPHGASAKGGHDMPREYRVLTQLTTTPVPVPRPLALCEDAAVLGSPFYVMERVRGVILRNAAVAAATTVPATMASLADTFVSTLTAIHAVDVSSTLAELTRGDGYAARQAKGWIDRYAKARTDDVADMETTAAWLASHTPRDSGQTLIHNDFKYDNLVLDASDITRVVAVLDWEMATVGDPLLDLGSSLGYWVDDDDTPEMKALSLSPTLAPGNLRRAEVVSRYAEVTGRDVGDMVFPYVMALFKIATIAQQIYARYARGLTTDERFGRLGMAVRALAQQAVQVVEKGRIDRLNA